MERKVLRYIQENALIPQGAEVTVALSGGADSVALLWVLRTLGPVLDLRLRAAHFHHGIRGEEADRDAGFCRDLCDDWGIPFALGRGDAPDRAARTGESLEEAARVLRYGWLRQTAAGGLIATAHNADDNAETVLLHLLRGTGLRGLGGIPPARDRLIRPLLCCGREEIEALLAREGLPHVEDSTNAADDCLRNRLRHRVLPLLRAENPGLTATLGRTAALLREEDAYLSRLSRQAALRCRAGAGYSCRLLLAEDPVLRRRVLLGALRDLGLENPSRQDVEALEGLLTAGPSARRPLAGGWEARRSYDLLLLARRETPAPLPETALQLPGTTVLPGGAGVVTGFVTKNSNFSQKNLNTLVLKYDMIAPRPCRVRGRRPGDRLTLPGGTKTLKALMIDRKLPARLRDRIPVLIVEDRVAAVFGLGVDPAFRPGPGDAVLTLRYYPQTEAPGRPDFDSDHREEEVNE